ncbi:3-oxo-5-alpha-steroid 4-dehydrogenase-domain-containing protein [Phycomyces blakesleeanus]|uniref:3-oxo-5-alpha-steroid 4-dehydrogenase C-terminal domain-containing protein n=2 Tax=Phycomyces blakesleeanus TaxID=4837 RepID=A0A167P1T3_PHYB8|nr:hypothetical protein PHYBLDRAFT_165578 [Phycomyces blakesleeanus NRRL 1555(-)]OAD77084.1 hypothetical protein PHYBLDRAFT_165578 [Phycomyces blakesleeanus NRRL 1555(-)]|eukprot:XP_018295124.1 hypothetical protein PHYBLDRAFT_165578 [Phycomyces blakesleeanus NRRL 1555(-)]
MAYITSIGLYVPEWTSFNVGLFILGICLCLSAVATETLEPTPYSKFGNRLVDTIPTRWAMLAMYLPSLLVCALPFDHPHWPFSRFEWIHTITFLHFFKRLIEVIWVHRYSGKTNIVTTVIISSTYTATSFFDLLVVSRMPSSVFSFGWGLAGLILVIVGETTNGYHHYLLRQLRKDIVDTKSSTSSAYRLPRGGLFEYAVAPHYFAEQLTYLGLIFLSQNVVSLSIKFFPMIYLTLRAARTHEWYYDNLLKSEKILLASRKRLIPFVW